MLTHSRGERSGRTRELGLTATLALAFVCILIMSVPAAHAGCGCNKPPPNLAAVRPNATYAGTPVTLFSPSFQVGQVYTVDFASGTTSARATVTATVANLRDLADGVYKPQLVVTLPNLPLGPTAISARLSNLITPVLVIKDDAFTVAPAPIAMPQDPGTTTYPGFTAAVGRDGTFYLSLDMTGITMPRVYQAQAQGFPLTFSESGTTFYNTQGFLMQLLLNQNQPIPGMFKVPAANPSADSSLLHYSRHEFNTYYLQHFERQPHQLDPTDPNWHLDGTRHVDHNHLVLGIAGNLANGAAPLPGATPPFTLVLQCFTLFSHGFVGKSAIAMSGTVTTDSYAPGSASAQSHGDVFTNGKLSMSNTATVNGNASAGSWNMSGKSKITGTKTTVTAPLIEMSVYLPPGLPDIGAIKLNGSTRTIQGPGSFLLADLILNTGSSLYIDNSAGPVTLYVTNQVAINGGAINVADPNPEKFAVYVTSTKDVSLTNTGSFNGVLYAPTSKLALSGSGEFFGSFVGAAVDASGNTRVHFDSALK